MAENGEMARANLTFGEFWEVIFGTPHPKGNVVNYGAISSVTRARILSRARSVYEKAISFVDHHPNPEEGHYIEGFGLLFFRTK